MGVRNRKLLASVPSDGSESMICTGLGVRLTGSRWRVGGGGISDPVRGGLKACS
jgi:hypothetical protein